MEESVLNTIENEFQEVKEICEPYKGNPGALLMVLQNDQDDYVAKGACGIWEGVGT